MRAGAALRWRRGGELQREGGRLMDWIYNDNCGRQLAALCLGIAAVGIGIAAALGYGLRWLMERGR